MKSIVTNRLTLLPTKLLTDISTFRAAIAAKILSCIDYLDSWLLTDIAIHGAPLAAKNKWI